MITAAGEEMESCGVIKIHWKLARNENRVYRESFFVLPDVRHLDVIMGQDIINKEDLLSMSTHRLFAPLAHKKLSDCGYHAEPLERGRYILTGLSL